jgi:hypothetical protein
MPPRMVTRLHEIFDEAVQRGILRESEAHNAHTQLDRMEAQGFTGEPTRPPEPRPQPVVKPEATPQTPTISPAARARMQEVKEALASEPVEHAIAWGVMPDGRLGFETSYTQGQHNQVVSSFPDILVRAKASGSTGVVVCHNHPRGTSAEFTEADNLATTALAKLLESHGITLLSSSIVIPPPERAERTPPYLLEGAWYERQAWYDAQPFWFKEATKALHWRR